MLEPEIGYPKMGYTEEAPTMRSVALVAALVVLSQPLFAQSPPVAVLTNADVVKMVEAGLPPEVVAASIRQAKDKNFTLTPDALIELKKKGVSDLVIAAMLNPVASPPTGVFPNRPAAVPSVNSNDPAQPHAMGIYLDAGEGANPRLVQLTEATVTGQSASGGFAKAFTGGLTKMKANYQVRDARAEHRTANPTPTFYAYGVDPRDYALLRMKIKARDKEREFTGLILGLTGNRAPKGDIEIDTEKVADGIYRVTPAMPLQPGEYCLASTTRGVVFAALDFGVDPRVPATVSR